MVFNLNESESDDSQKVEIEGETRVQFEADRWGIGMLVKEERRDTKVSIGVGTTRQKGLYEERKFRLPAGIIKDQVSPGGVNIELAKRRHTHRQSLGKQHRLSTDPDQRNFSTRKNN